MNTTHHARLTVLLAVGLVCLSPTELKAQFRGARDYTKRIAPQLPPPQPVRPVTAGQTVTTSTVPVKVVDPAVLKADKEEAAKKLLAYQKERAEAGSESGQLAMGVRYMIGDGVEKDYAAARKWLEASAKQGNDDAKKRLEELKKLEAADVKAAPAKAAPPAK